MKISLIFFVFIVVESIRDDFCPNCRGKIHQKEDLRLTERNLLIDKKNVCLERTNPFVVVVKSGNFQRRNLTRSTWAKQLIEYFNVRILYALAIPKNLSEQKSIENENEIYRDILQFDFEENYYNLTIKTLSVFHWFDRWCWNRTRFLLYVDDDLLINVDRLMINLPRLDLTNSIFGWFENSGRIQRRGIGGVSKIDFPIDRVPDYLWGAAVVYPSEILHHRLLPGVYQTNLPIFFRDDVFINGFIAEETSVQRKHFKGIRLYDRTEDDLKNQIFLIDFPDEEHRRRAWICFQEQKFCNKNLGKLIMKIIFYIFSILFCFGFLLRRFIFSSWKRKTWSKVGSNRPKFSLRQISLPFLFSILFILISLHLLT